MTARRTPRQQFNRDFALLFGIPAAILALLIFWWGPWRPAFELPDDTDLFSVVAGTWSWEGEDGGCDSPHRITFDSAHKVMTITHAEPWVDSTGVPDVGAVYDIRVVRGNIRGDMRGETRLTDEGTPVVWDLVLTSRDSYKWRRTDWAGAAGTAEIERCRPDAISDEADRAMDHPERVTALFENAKGAFHTALGHQGRVWGITADPIHFVGVDDRTPGAERFHLITVSDSIVRIDDGSAPISGAERFILKSWHVADRWLILIEPLQGDSSLGLHAFEVVKGALIAHRFPRVAIADNIDNVPTIDAVEVSERKGSFRVQIVADLDEFVSEASSKPRLICRTLGLGHISFQETSEGWRMEGGMVESVCE